MNSDNSKQLEALIRKVPDFPDKGILFYDISTLLSDPDGFKLSINCMQEITQGLDFDLLAAVDSRGFIFGAALADRYDKGLLLVRKPGKLPPPTFSYEYGLEYGQDALEVYKDAIKPGTRVLIVDDLLATGGTVEAAIGLVQQLGGVVTNAIFLIELLELNGRAKISDIDCQAVMNF